MNKYRYAVDGEGFDDSFEIESCWCGANLDYIAQEAAEDFHNNNEGWEWDTPIDFEIFTEDGESLGRFEVLREYSPTFTAIEID